MYVLHYAPDNASLILRLALDEARLPYRTELVDRSIREQDSAAYRALNPTGLIPTLTTPDGPISETAACLLWLADRHPEAGLGAAIGTSQRGAFLRWLFFLSNTVHADLRQLFYPTQYVPPHSVPGHHALVSARLLGHFTLLDDAAALHPDLFAPPSVLGLYTATLMRWSVLYPRSGPKWFRPAQHPTLMRLAQRLDTRTATLTAILAEGLGPKPFSDPHPPKPPQGSAI